MVVITSNERDVIFDAVRGMYTEVARYPERGFHFLIGRPACEFVGYPSEVLDELPARAVESFAGVGYPFQADAIRPGDTVLDIGSGAGTDAFTALRGVGPDGEVIGLDMTDAMREKLRATAEALGETRIRLIDANAESIPLPDASVDVVTSNGVINLVPDKPAAVAEIFRVLRPGGRVQIADIVLTEPPSPACRTQPELWAECIVGATTEPEYLEYFREAGFEDVDRIDSLDYFESSRSEETRKLANDLGAGSIVMRGRKPE
ncbi:MAG: methyltransferase domain-containing protein [Gemmatimonadota bacterium]